MSFHSPLSFAAPIALSAFVALVVQESPRAPADETAAPKKGGAAKAGDDKETDSKDGASKYVLPNWPNTTFKEVAKASGIDAVNLSGEPDKPRLIDTLGVGLCWFDYDGDGWLDLFVPNGSTMDVILGKKVKVTKPDGTVDEVPVTNPATDKLFRNNGDGTFTDVTDKAGLHDDRWGLSATAADFDNDGDQDLYVCNFGLNFLYRNNGDGTFTDIAESAGVQFDGVTPGSGWGDIDGDGDLDLYVSAYIEYNKKAPWPRFAKTMRGMKVMLGPQGLTGAPDKLFRNDGDGKFTDVTKVSGMRTAEMEHGFTVQMLDLDRDDLLDIFVANDMTPNHHYKQLKPGKFTPRGSQSGLEFNHEGTAVANMGVGIVDVNDDLYPDVFTTDFAAQEDAFWVSQYDAKNKEVTWKEDPSPISKARTNMAYVGWGTGFYDFDLDGDEDLLEVNGHVFPQVDTERPRVQDYEQYGFLYRRDGPLNFSDASKACGPDFYVQRNCRGVAFGDYDDDGDVDLAVSQLDKPVLLMRNEVAHSGHFVRVQLLGTSIHRDAYGSRITLEADGRRQTRWLLGQGSFLSQNDPRVLFGLGLCDKVDRITVRWCGGKEEVIEGPKDKDGKPTPLAVDRTLVIKEDMGLVAELTGAPLPKEQDPKQARTPQLTTRAAANALQEQAKAKGLVKQPVSPRPAAAPPPAPAPSPSGEKTPQDH